MEHPLFLLPSSAADLDGSARKLLYVIYSCSKSCKLRRNNPLLNRSHKVGRMRDDPFIQGENLRILKILPFDQREMILSLGHLLWLSAESFCPFAGTPAPLHRQQLAHALAGRPEWVAIPLEVRNRIYRLAFHRSNRISR